MPIWKGFVKKPDKALITGIAGFAGSYLAELLLLRGINVYGLLAPREKTDNIKSILPGLKLERFDIRKADKMSSFIKKAKPDYIFHLAAMASVGKSFDMVRRVYDINFVGSQSLFEAACGAKNLKKLIFVSSSDAYGQFKPIRKILKEEQPFNPISPYGISKAAGEYLALYYFRNNRIPVVRARSFNHTGPRQSDDFVVPSFCKQIALIEKGARRPVLSVGDLSAKRDLSDVRDIVRGYYLMAIRGKPGEVYQLCSGKTTAIDSVLKKLIRYSDKKIQIVVDKKRLRKSDIPVLHGSNAKAGKELGWFCRFKLDETLKFTLDYWRGKTSQE